MKGLGIELNFSFYFKMELYSVAYILVELASKVLLSQTRNMCFLLQAWLYIDVIVAYK